MKKMVFLVFSVIFPLIMTAQVQLTEVNCSNGIDDDGDGLIDCIDPDCIGSPDCASLNNGPVLNGVTEGTGTFFEVVNSDYLNITLASSTEITIFLSSVPQMISMNISRPATVPAPYEATLTITGLLPLTVYYKYDDSYHNLDSILTDANGNYTWIQDLNEAHHVWIQPTRSTIFICDDATGCGCETVGTWNSATKTCTLTIDVIGAIQIDSPGITLDGAGKSITGDSTGYGVLIPTNVNNVTVKNCVISNFTVGIHLQSSSNSTLTGNNTSNNYYSGILLSTSSNNNLNNNKASNNNNGYGISLYLSSYNNLLNNNVSSNGIGISLITSTNNTLTNDTASNNNSYGIWLFSSSYNNLTDNIANSNIIGIYLYDGSDYNTLTNNTANSNSVGIYLYNGSDHNALTNNTANSNTNGIYRDLSSDYNTLTNNTANLNGNGIFLYNSSDNNLTVNAASNNSNGILLSTSSNNNLLNNTINSNSTGLFLYDVTGNNFTDNIVSNSTNYGMYVQSCQNNTIGGTSPQQPNAITNNGLSGIYLTASTGIKISGNSIYNNPIAVQNVDGSNNNKAAPVIVSFDGTTVTGTSEPGDIVEIFGSADNENANEYLTTIAADANGDWTANVSTTYEGVVATATDGSNNTSMLSGYFAIPQQPGATCENAVVIEPSTFYHEFSIEQNNEYWLRFVPDTSIYIIKLLNNNSIENVELFSGNCGSLTSIDISDSLLIIYNNFTSGNDYYLKITSNTNCSFFININTVIFGTSGTCDPTNCTLLGNYDYENLACTSNFDNAFYLGCVSCWTCAWGSPSISSGSIYSAYLWSRLNNNKFEGEAIYQKINIIPNRMYKFEAKYRALPGTNTNNASLFFKFLTQAQFNAIPSFPACASNGGGTNYSTFHNNYLLNPYFYISQSNLSTNWSNITLNISTQSFPNTNYYLLVYPHQPSSYDHVATKIDYIDIHFPRPNFVYYADECSNVYNFSDITEFRTINNHNQIWQIQNSSNITIATSSSYWPNTPANYSFSFPSSGIYYITLTYEYLDDNGVIISTCSRTDTINVNYLTSTLSIDDNSVCAGWDYTLQATALGGTPPYTYYWPVGSSTSPQNTFTGIAGQSGTLTVTITDSSVPPCSSTSTVYLEVLPNPEIVVIPINGVCLGDLGAADLIVLPDNVNYQVSWSNGQQGYNLFYIDGLDGGQYSVTVTHPNGCSTTSTFFMAEGTVFVNASITAQNQIMCPGTAIGSATASVSGGGGWSLPITYHWSNGSSSSTISGLSAGTYTVTVTEGNGCTSTASVTFTNYVLPHFTLLTFAPVCGCDASISVIPAVFTNYLWSNGATTSSINNVCSGNYSVTVTDVNGCTQVQSISVPFVISFNVTVSTTNVTCAGLGNGTATVNLPFGTNPSSCSYIWSNGGTTQTITGLNPGTYSVTVTNSNGCTAVAQGSVIQPHLLTVGTYVIHQVCNGVCSGQIGVLLSGGTPPLSYSWSNGSTSAQLNNLCAGLYILTVTDAHGCTAVSQPIILVEPPAFSYSLSQTNVLCAYDCDGSASINITGGTSPYSYLWCNSQTTAGASNLCAEICSVTVTDAHGCTLTSNVTITEPSPISVSVSTTNVPCYGGSNGSATISVFGGVPGYTYLWSNGQTTQTAIGLTASTYAVTVTDANGCTAIENGTVSQPGNFTVGFIIPYTPIQCFGGTTFIGTFISGGTGPYTYLWSNGSTSSYIYPNAGTYSVTVTDANGCTATAIQPVTLIDPPQLNVSVYPTNVLCYGGTTGSATVTAGGGTPGYTYAWSNNQTNATAIGLSAGNYSVTVTDAHICTSSINVTITEPQVLTATLTVQNTCPGQNNGVVTVTATGGTPPYYYNGNTQNSATGVPAGTYPVTVTDANGCFFNLTAVVSETQTFTLSFIQTDNDACIAPPCNGGIDISVINISSPGGFTYQWTSNAWPTGTVNTNEDQSGLCPGVYNVIATDVNGCIASSTASITDMPFTSCPPVYTENIIIKGNNIYQMDQWGNQIPFPNIFSTGNTYDILGNIILFESNDPLVPTVLTINNGTKLRFRHECSIIVNPGCSLFVTQSGTLLTSCDINCPPMWGGIYANSIYPNRPALVHISDDATIENAMVAVEAENNVKVTCALSHFLNNERGILLNNTTLEHNVNGNEFLTNNFYLWNYSPHPLFHIRANNNFNFPLILEGNTFINNSTWTAQQFTRGAGIIAYNTRIKVSNTGYYDFQNPANSIPGFSGLWYGIASNSYAGVTNNYFVGNNRAIRIEAIQSSGSRVNNNVIDVGNLGYDNSSGNTAAATINWGIAFLNAPVFQVYENQISNGLVGIVTNTTTNQGNVVYNNTFDNMYVGCVALGNNQLLYNCNNFLNQNETGWGQFPPFLGGDMVIFDNASSVFSVQTMHGTFDFSTYNRVDQSNCGTNPSKNFYNNSNTVYTYWYCNDNDESDIRFCSDNVTTPGNVDPFADPPSGPTNDYGNTHNANCPLGTPGGGNKSFAASFITSDSLSDAKEYQQNVLLSLTDNGNTTYFLNKIAVLAPNNFTKFYNELMSASPYLSDTVLIAFMTHPINKPAHKKNVVMANSPLPYRVRQYIDLMNVNQNFKNQMWAAQTGTPNARVSLENYIKWLSNRRQVEINGLVVRCSEDTIGFETDSLINYLASSVILDDRIVRYGLCMKKDDYSTASSELNAINGLTGDLSLQKQQEFEDFADVAGILINTLLEDSVADSIILANQAFLEDIANTEFHLAQGDAKALLEQAGIPQEYYVWLPDGSVAKNAVKPFSEKDIPEICRKMVVFPNPSNGNMIIKYDLMDEEGEAEISLTAHDGKSVNTYLLNERKGEVVINCNTCVTGNYILTLYVDGSVECSKNINIKK
jgi:parallel beta-helix repeat protein